MPYRIEYPADAEEQLRTLSIRQRRTLVDAVEEQLAHQPTGETRNRKQMRPNSLAAWELRVGNLRVYYDVQDAPESVVFVRAIGIKERNQVWIAGRPSRF